MWGLELYSQQRAGDLPLHLDLTYQRSLETCGGNIDPDETGCELAGVAIIRLSEDVDTYTFASFICRNVTVTRSQAHRALVLLMRSIDRALNQNVQCAYWLPALIPGLEAVYDRLSFSFASSWS